MKFLKGRSDAIARGAFVVALLMFAFAYGVGASQFDLFPVPLIRSAKAAAEQLLEETGAALPWYYQHTTQTQQVRTRSGATPVPGLRLIAGLGADEKTVVNVVDVNGGVVHRWQIDWFAIWPDPKHLSEDLIPKSNAGLVHGVALMPDGGLVFNFEELGMVRLDACGNVAWKLPYRTHHSIQVDERGHIWAPGVVTRHEQRANLPNYEPPWHGFTIVEVTPDGRLERELSVPDLLLENGLRGLLYMSTTHNRNTRVTGDTLHLNDVELFPASMPAGVFAPGDVMISLRNINTVLVFDSKTWKVKFQSVGALLRQHDPDFVDGDTISVFDNNNLARWTRGVTTPDPAGHHSRVVKIGARTNQLDVLFSGSAAEPFFTDIMGTHQMMPNGHMLLAESIAGRVVEVDAAGAIVWEYFNLAGNGLVAAVSDALWLSPQFDRAFFANAVSSCRAASSS